jgi:hypothetical protein
MIAHDIMNYGDIVKNCCQMALSQVLNEDAINHTKDIVFRFIIEYSSLRDFGPLGNRSIYFYMRSFER